MIIFIKRCFEIFFSLFIEPLKLRLLNLSPDFAEILFRRLIYMNNSLDAQMPLQSVLTVQGQVLENLGLQFP